LKVPVAFTVWVTPGSSTERCTEVTVAWYKTYRLGEWAHHPPRRRSITGTVRNMILRSSSVD
jgi:hypothetical protein